MTPITPNQPDESNASSTTRRHFLKTTGGVAAATALAGASVPAVHAGEDNTIRVALIGCGGRGTGAAGDSLQPEHGPTQLVALADVFPDRLSRTYEALKGRYASQMDVPEDRRFVGFDAYQHAMDCLRPSDVVVLATPPAFRWVHFTYAIAKGLNVFMEKPVTVDGPSTRRMLELGRLSEQKNLKVGVGLMCRHCDARLELFDRIQSGEIGELIALRAYRMSGPVGSAFVAPKPNDMSELLYQIKNFHGFLWASGGSYSDFLIHNVDETCWMKNAWPVEAKACGGRHFRGDYVDQNLDTYSVDYTFGDGSKFYLNGRNVPGCFDEFASYAHGSKGSAVISTSSHSPAKCRTFKGQKFVKEDLIWAYPQPERSPYRLEWNHLMEAIRQNKPYNEVQRGAEASLVCVMGRMAAHTGQVVTWDQALNNPHEFAPDLEKLTLDGPAPLQLAANGKYPVPEPGVTSDREY